MITTLAIATQLLFVVLPALVLHRAIAVRLLKLDQAADPLGEITENDLLLYGLLPSLAIAGTIGTVLALFGLFRTALFSATVVLLLIWRWRDALATLAAIAEQVRSIGRSIARGELMTLLALAIFARTAVALFIYAQLPNENVDVWNHQVPLAQSIISHAGFVMPQIDHWFYGTYPIFFNLLFAEGFLYVDDVTAANVINCLLYFAFLLGLLGCARHGRAIAVVVISILVINSPFLTSGAAQAMTDLPRTCFSVLALVFAYRYLRDRRAYFLLASGLLAGAAVAGKFTELFTPILICLSLLPLLRDRRNWTAIFIFAAASLPIASYPFLRNWILLGNPIYPWFFGHPGLTDAWMADLMVEMTRPFNPADRVYVTNLLTLRGWHDFFIVVNQTFFTGYRTSSIALGLLAVGSCLPRSRLIYMLAWSAALAVAWYTVMFNSTRWAMPSYLTMLSGGFLAFAWMLDRFVLVMEPRSSNWHSLFPGTTSLDAWFARIPGWLTPKVAMRIALAVLAIYLCIPVVKRYEQNGAIALLPPWMDGRLAEAALRPGGIDAYLVETRKGYELYRYIAEQNLKTVMQPFDNGAVFYEAAYNGGHSGNRILTFQKVPSGPDDFEHFLSSNDINYFIYRRSLEPIETERLGPDRMKMAYELFQSIMPKSHRILVDPFGWELYAIDGARIPLH